MLSCGPSPEAQAPIVLVPEGCATAETDIVRAEGALAEGRLLAAAAALEHAHEGCPTTPARTTTRWADTLIELGRYEQARTVLARVDEATAAPLLARLEGLDQSKPRELATMRPMLETLNRALAAERSGAHDEAEKLFVAAWQGWHPNGPALQGAARMAARRGDHVEARRRWSRAVAELERATGKKARVWVRDAELDGLPRPVRSDDGASILLRSNAGPLRVFDAATLAPYVTAAEATAIEAEPVGDLAATYHLEENRVTVWHLPTGIVVANYELSRPPAEGFRPRLAVLGDGTVVLADGNELRRLDADTAWRAHGSEVVGLRPLAGGRLLSWSTDELALWAGGENLGRWATSLSWNGPPATLDRQRFAIHVGDDILVIGHDGLVIRRFASPTPDAWFDRFLSDGSLAWRVGQEATVVGDPDSGTTLRFAGKVVAEVDDETLLVKTVAADGVPRFMRGLRRDGRLEPLSPTMASSLGPFSAQDDDVAIDRSGGTLHWFSRGRIISILYNDALAVTGVAADFAGQRLGAQSANGTITLWSPRSRPRQLSRPTPGDCDDWAQHRRLAFAGPKVVSGCGTLDLFDLDGGKLIASLVSPVPADPGTIAIRGVAVSRDGRRAVTLGSARLLWDLATRTARAIPDAAQLATLGFVCYKTCSATPQATRLRSLLPEYIAAVTASRDGAFGAWAVPGEEIAPNGEAVIDVVVTDLRGPHVVTRGRGLATTRLEVSPSGAHWAEVDHFGDVRLVGEDQATRPFARVTDASFLGDRLLASGDSNGSLHLWGVPEAQLLLTLRVTRRGDAYAVSADGRVELFDSGLRETLGCRVGRHVLPFEACEDSILASGLLDELFPPIP